MSAARRDSTSSCRDVVVWSPPRAPPSVFAVCAKAGWRVVSYLVGLIVDTSSATATIAADAIVPTSVRRMAEPSISYPSTPAAITFTDPWSSSRIRADSLDVGHIPRSRTGSFDPSAAGSLQRRGSASSAHGGRTRQASAPNVLLSSAASCPGQLASIADGTTSALWTRRRLGSASPLPVSIPEIDGSLRHGQRRGSSATIEFAPPTRSPLASSMSATDVRLPPVPTIGRAWGRPATPLARSVALPSPAPPLVDSPAPTMASSPSVWSWWGGGLAAMAAAPIVAEISADADEIWTPPDRPSTPALTEFVTWRMVRRRCSARSDAAGLVRLAVEPGRLDGTQVSDGHEHDMHKRIALYSVALYHRDRPSRIIAERRSTRSYSSRFA